MPSSDSLKRALLTSSPTPPTSRGFFGHMPHFWGFPGMKLLPGMRGASRPPCTRTIRKKKKMRVAPRLPGIKRSPVVAAGSFPSSSWPLWWWLPTSSKTRGRSRLKPPSRLTLPRHYRWRHQSFHPVHRLKDTRKQPGSRLRRGRLTPGRLMPSHRGRG